MVSPEASVEAQMDRAILGLLLLLIPYFSETGRAVKHCQAKYNQHGSWTFRAL